jgi:hypothetical protein
MPTCGRSPDHADVRAEPDHADLSAVLPARAHSFDSATSPKAWCHPSVVRVAALICLLVVLAGCADDAASPQSASDTYANAPSPSAVDASDPTPATSVEPAASSATPVGEPVTATRKPIPVAGGGTTVSLDLTGYGANTTADVMYGGDVLATLTASQDGEITGPVTLPEAPPGVLVIEVRGEACCGTGFGHDLRLLYPGKPHAGQDYWIYVEGFEPRPDHIESDYKLDEVAVTLDDYDFGGLFDTTVDVEGGVLLFFPLPLGVPTHELVVTSKKTGVVKTILIEVSD